MPKNDENVPFFENITIENITIDTLTVIQYRFFHVTIFILMSSGNWKIPYVVNYLVTVYKQAFGAYPLPKSNFLSFHFIIPLDKLLYDVCREADSAMPKRNVKIISSFEKGIIVKTDKNILNTVCCGLLKNAIENTPDEGKIEITAKTVNGETIVDFHDYGVGITLQNQKIIFGGFFIHRTHAYIHLRNLMSSMQEALEQIY